MDSDEQSVCCATIRLFKVGDIYILDELKRLVVHFGLIWNSVASRSGSSFRCNRYTRPGTCSRRVKLRNTTPFAYGCGWCIRFNWIIVGRRNDIDCVKITYIYGSHTNTCDPYNVDQLALVRTRASSYKKCTDQVLSKIMVRMNRSYSIDIQSMVEVLRKVLLERKDIDRHMVYNVRLRAHHCKLELKADNVEILVHHFDTSFIKDYKSNSVNYSKGQFHLVSFMLVVFDNLINIFCIIIDYRITLCFKLLFLYPCCLYWCCYNIISTFYNVDISHSNVLITIILL